jgi:hypothetical protein
MEQDEDFDVDIFLNLDDQDQPQKKRKVSSNSRNIFEEMKSYLHEEQEVQEHEKHGKQEIQEQVKEQGKEQDKYQGIVEGKQEVQEIKEGKQEVQEIKEGKQEVNPVPIKKYLKPKKMIKLEREKFTKEDDYFLSNSPMEPYPFYNEIQDLVDEEYRKFLPKVYEGFDKSPMLGTWSFDSYMKKMKFVFKSNFQDINHTVGIIYFYISRLGDVFQYREQNKYLKFKIISHLIENQILHPKQKYFYWNIQPNQTKSKKQNSNVIQLLLHLGEFYLKNGDHYPSENLVESGQYEFELQKVPFIPSLKESKLMNNPLKLVKKGVSSSLFLINSLTGILESQIIQFKNNELLIPENLIDDLKNCKERYFICPLTLPAHMNILIFDKKLKTMERFEPNGTTYEDVIALFFENESAIEYIYEMGWDDMLNKIRNSNYDYKLFRDDDSFISFLRNLSMIKSTSIDDFEKYKSMLIQAHSYFETDKKLKQLRNSDLYLKQFKLLLPSDYQKPVGPQVVFDRFGGVESPRGLCVTVSYFYACLRLQYKVDSVDNIREMNEKIYSVFFNGMFSWYNQYMEPIKKEEISNQIKFVGLGLGDFMLQALNELGWLTSQLNQIFGTSILFMDGRNLMI